MTFNAFAFGQNPGRVLDALVHDYQAPAHIWVPLDVEHASGRSGWHTVRRQAIYGQWADTNDVNCVWPTVFLRWYLGPYALLPDAAVSGRDVARSRVKRRDGIWYARVPRFFETIGKRWSSNIWYNAKRSADAGEGSTVKKVDLQKNLNDYDPVLIVGPEGPCFYEPKRSEGFEERRLAAIGKLMQLPPRTSVKLVTFDPPEEERDYEDYGWGGLYRREADPW